MLKYSWVIFLLTTLSGCSTLHSAYATEQQYFQQQLQPMVNAIDRENVDEITRLVKSGYDVNTRGSVYRQGRLIQWTYLNYAVEKGKLKSAQRLIDLGANVNDLVIDGSGYSSNLNIASENGDKFLIELLIKNGIQMDCNICASPLYDLVMNNNHDKSLYELLISNGANVNHPEYISGTTALITAYDLDRVDLVDYFLAKGANPKQFDSNGHNFASIIQKDLDDKVKLKIAQKYKQQLSNQYGISFPVKPSFRKGLEASIKRYENTTAKEKQLMGQAEVERIELYKTALKKGNLDGVPLD